MILLENPMTYGWEAAIRGMRNPMNSWANSDSTFEPYLLLGRRDLQLMQSLIKAGTDHRKFLRMITVTFDVTAPLYWWKEFDTYKIGTVANSCSTMHKIQAAEFTRGQFSCEHLKGESLQVLDKVIATLNQMRENYLQSHDKEDWWQLIQLLPSSYNQQRTISLNYEVLCRIYKARCNHKLDEWRDFCDFILQLPCAEELILLKEGAYDSIDW